MDAVTDAAPVAPVLLRMDAPVGHVTQYHMQTQLWLPGFPTNKPGIVDTYGMTESITAVKGDVRTISTVVVSSHTWIWNGSPFLRSWWHMHKGRTTVRQMDSRGRVLSSHVTKEGSRNFYDIRGIYRDTAPERPGSGPAPYAGSTFTLPEGPVGVGDSWTATETMPAWPNTGGLTATVQVTYRLEQIGFKGGARVAVISMNGAVTDCFFPDGRDATRESLSGRTMSGELRLDLDSKWMAGLTISMDNKWGTTQGSKACKTMVPVERRSKP